MQLFEDRVSLLCFYVQEFVSLVSKGVRMSVRVDGNEVKVVEQYVKEVYGQKIMGF